MTTTNNSVYDENIRLEPKTALDGKLAKTHVVFFLLTRKRRKQPIHAEKFVHNELRDLFSRVLWKDRQREELPGTGPEGFEHVRI